MELTTASQLRRLTISSRHLTNTIHEHGATSHHTPNNHRSARSRVTRQRCSSNGFFNPNWIYRSTVRSDADASNSSPQDQRLSTIRPQPVLDADPSSEIIPPEPARTPPAPNLVNFNQFLTQHNINTTPIARRPRSNSSTATAASINLAIELMMQKSIAIRRSQHDNTSAVVHPNRMGADAQTPQDFTTFVNLVRNTTKNSSKENAENVPPIAHRSKAHHSSSEDLKISDTCVVCLTHRKEYCIPNCNHLCLCQKCSNMFREVGAQSPSSDDDQPDICHKCPLCREPIQGRPFRIYR